MPEIAIEADPPLYRNLVMGKFAVTTEIAARSALPDSHLMTFDELTDAGERSLPAAIVGSSTLNLPKWDFFGRSPASPPPVRRKPGSGQWRSATTTSRIQQTQYVSRCGSPTIDSAYSCSRSISDFAFKCGDRTPLSNKRVSAAVPDCAKWLMIYAFWGWFGVAFTLSKADACDGGRK